MKPGSSEVTPSSPVSLPKTMRAGVMVAPQQMEVRQVPLPAPGRGEILVQLEGCGVCASSLPVYQGRPWFNYPLSPGAPGHEGWGRVVALGPGVEAPQVGQRVSIISEHAFAEYDVAPAAAAVVLPGQLGGMVFPGEPLGCAMNIYRRSEISAGQTVAVVGVGFLGALLIELASGTGARVVGFSRRRFALQLARQQGAVEAVSTADAEEALRQGLALTGGAGFDRVIEAVGIQATLDLSSQLTRERGRLIVAGYHQDGTRQVNMQLWNWRGLDVINAHERDPRIYAEGTAAAVDLVVGGRLEPQRLLTHSFSLNQIGEAFQAMDSRPEGFLKAVVLP